MNEGFAASAFQSSRLISPARVTAPSACGGEEKTVQEKLSAVKRLFSQ
jgi:hypothetical protein